MTPEDSLARAWGHMSAVVAANRKPERQLQTIVAVSRELERKLKVASFSSGSLQGDSLNFSGEK